MGPYHANRKHNSAASLGDSNKYYIDNTVTEEGERDATLDEPDRTMRLQSISTQHSEVPWCTVKTYGNAPTATASPTVDRRHTSTSTSIPIPIPTSNAVEAHTHQELMEERVVDLELKLATLSRLLQTMRLSGTTTNTFSTTPPSSNTLTIGNGKHSIRTPERCVSPNTKECSQQEQRTRLGAHHPALESPAPHESLQRRTIFQEQQKQHQHQQQLDVNNNVNNFNPAMPTPIPPIVEGYGVDNLDNNNSASATPTELSQRKRNRNLSLMLLFEGDEEAYQEQWKSDPLAGGSMTPAERLWLRPQLLQYQQQSHQQQYHIDSGICSNENDVQPNMYKHEKDIHQHFIPMEKDEEKETIQRSHCTSCPFSVAFESNTATSCSVSGGGGDLSVTSDDNSHRTRSSSITQELLKQKLHTKWLDYLNSVQEATPDVDVQMQEFIKVPHALEGILAFGLLICLDAFLYMCTVLPIRLVWSCLLLLIRATRGKHNVPENFRFHRRHFYQIIQCIIVYVISRYVLFPISIGKLYHWIRGQAMIKLYMIIAMVEIFDRLFSSLGQDCLDSMYWNSITRPGSSRFLVSVLVVLVYAALHTLILFVHAATLNVAMNSHDQALLSLLIGGNFAEIKSTVFKKFNKAALFKVTAADICERFKLALFLSLVMLLNASQEGGMSQHQFWGYVRTCGIVYFAELMADWIKHSFITKFNFLPAHVYPEYALLLAGDVTGIGHEGVSLDHSHAVVKRLGFAQIPLLCVMFRLVNEAIQKFLRHSSHIKANLAGGDDSSWSLMRLLQSSTVYAVTVLFLFWVVLLVLKLGLGLLLEHLSYAKLYAAPEYSQLTPLIMTQQQQQAAATVPKSKIKTN